MKVKIGYFKSLLLSLPILLIYMYEFIDSMQTSRDRLSYLNIMTQPFSTREEPLIHYISYILGYFVPYADVKLIILQISFFSLLSLALLKGLKAYVFTNLAKFLFSLLLILLIFSAMFIIQLRIGYACIILVFIIFFLNLKPALKNLPIFIIPCLMHMGVIVPIVFLYMFYYFKINTLKKFMAIFIISLVITTLTIQYLSDLFVYIGLNGYYFDYLDSDTEFGRKYPVTVIFYLVLIGISIFLIYQSNKNNFMYFYCLYGLLLVYVGGVLNFYLAYKILTPIMMIFLIFFIRELKITYSTAVIFLAFTIFPGLSLLYSALKFQGNF